MKLLCFDIILSIIYVVSMAYLFHELRILNPKARREWQTGPMLMAVTVLYVVVIWKTHALAAMFRGG